MTRPNEPTVLPKRTHCYELMRLIAIRCQWDFTRQHYLADGIYAEFADPFDGQEYEITIKPKGEGDE